MPMTFQVRSRGWVFWQSSQARTIICLPPTRRSTSTSISHSRQHQKRPCSVGYSSLLSLATSHVSPSSKLSSIRVTLRPPPE